MAPGLTVFEGEILCVGRMPFAKKAESLVLFYRVGYGMQLCGRMHKGVVAVQFALCFNRERKKKVAAALAVRNQIV